MQVDVCLLRFWKQNTILNNQCFVSVRVHYCVTSKGNPQFTFKFGRNLRCESVATGISLFSLAVQFLLWLSSMGDCSLVGRCRQRDTCQCTFSYQRQKSQLHFDNENVCMYQMFKSKSPSQERYSNVAVIYSAWPLLRLITISDFSKNRLVVCLIWIPNPVFW